MKTKALLSVHASLLLFVLWAVCCASPSQAQTITPNDGWKNTVVFGRDPFFDVGRAGNSGWVKFMILLEPYDSNLVYYQKSRDYPLHYNAAVTMYDPFLGMSIGKFSQVSLYKENQQAILGAIVLPPFDWETRQLSVREYGIQFIRQDLFSKEEVRDLFNLVKSTVQSSEEVQAFYFPTFEQQTVALENKDWFSQQGIPMSSTGRWATGNTSYSTGWALGPVTFITASEIETAYRDGRLTPNDILLTDGIPAELPPLAGIVSLVPSTPNSHVALLARTYGIPFVHLLLEEDRERIQALEDRHVVFSAYYDFFDKLEIQFLDVEHLDEQTLVEIQNMHLLEPLIVKPMIAAGTLGMSTLGLLPSDINRIGGKASNYGILRAALPNQSPSAMALTFDLWNAFLDQSLQKVAPIILAPGEHKLIWADNDPGQGSDHAGFRLSKKGEAIAIYARDGLTLIDSIRFDKQETDRSYGRTGDGAASWQTFAVPTPGGSNPGVANNTVGLVINEFMADNKTALEDPSHPGTHPDWIELYNGSEHSITLNGLYLTDDINEPTKWQIPESGVENTLREEIMARLADHQHYPPEMQALSEALASIRNLFVNGDNTQFSEELKGEILYHLQDPNYGFNPQAMLRFRSSTNVEDSEDFIGAGLYDSYSGCLADSLPDKTSEIPCLCDPNRDSARTVFSAIRKTMASFYNTNAYLERLRHQVSEEEVGMAVLVHHSFPDELELANGVATIAVTPGANTEINLVTQTGAVSVTNPEDASTPEEVLILIYPNGNVVGPLFVRPSSRIPLGSYVMTWSDDYTELTDLIVQVSDEFQRTTGKTEYVLDLEYKKMAPGDQTVPNGGLVVKQVREVPTPDDTPSKIPYLLNIPQEYEIFTGEFRLEESVDVFAAHRLKSRWSIATQNMPLDSNHLETSLYTDVTLEYNAGDHVETISGPLSEMPNAQHELLGDYTLDKWTISTPDGVRTYGLKTEIPLAVSAAENPILTLTELGKHDFASVAKFLTLTVDYDQSVTQWQEGYTGGKVGNTKQNSVQLWLRDSEPREDDLYQEREFSDQGITIVSRFYFPKPPVGETWRAVLQSTGPVKRWEQTTITGLTSEPILLKGYYSQTFEPYHHNLFEHFLFEPQLEPGISSEILAQLQAADIRWIHMIITFDGNDEISNDLSEITTYGFDMK